MEDPFNLERFVAAQAQVFDDVRSELMRGAKTGHWMWFVFPQLKGLARSATSELYGIASLMEAKAYLVHPILGPRLAECCGLVAAIEGRSAQQIFGFPDNLKLRSSMTLFAKATSDDDIYRKVLQKYFDSEPDPLTLQILSEPR